MRSLFLSITAVAALSLPAQLQAQSAAPKDPVVLGPVREVALIDRFGADPVGAWVVTSGENVATMLSPRRRVAGLHDPILEASASLKNPRDREPGRTWMSLTRKALPDAIVPADVDGFCFVLGSRAEAQWWISVTLTTAMGESFTTVLADHAFPAGRLVHYTVPLARFQSATKQALSPEKAVGLRGISIAVSTAGTSLYFDRIAAYKRDRMASWLDFGTSHPSNNLFQRGDPVTITFCPGGMSPPNATGFRYEVRDVEGRVSSRRSARLTGAAEYRFNATPRMHGYYGVTAFLVDADGKDLAPNSCIRAEGSMPDGLGTFSVLPTTLAENIARFRKLGESAFFGLHGDFLHLADYAGLTWRFDYSDWRYLETTRPDRSAGLAQWARDAIRQGPEPRYRPHILPSTLNIGESTPAWARSRDGKAPGFAWDDALAMVRDRVKVEMARRPHMRRRLYGGLWEVDLNMPPDRARKPDYTPADIADAYRRIRKLVRAEDPTGLVIGPCSSIIRSNWFEAVFRAGVLRWVDGIETHAYPDGRFTPEADDLPGRLQRLQALVRRYNHGKPLPLYITELGQTGILGDEIIALSQAQRMVRACIILKGEGARVFLPFYGIDYDRAGYWGFLYNLDLDSRAGPWETKRGSPKPLVNAVAACALLLEGATPRGRVRGLGRDVWAYAFYHRGTRITAVWSPAGTRTAMVPAGRARRAEVTDMTGHSTSVSAVHGAVRLTVGESPVYVCVPAQKRR